VGVYHGQIVSTGQGGGEAAERSALREHAIALANHPKP
jgi:hypothetical protein